MSHPSWNRPARLAAVGVIVALSGAVRFADAEQLQATNLGTPSSFVPIQPCRALDTRPTDEPGPQGRPLGSAETMTLRVGTNCLVPVTATGITANVTIANPSADSFLTVFPAGVRPLASSLNWTAGSAPTANQVTVGLSNDGWISIYNHFGTVDVIVDVLGYYVGAASLHETTLLDTTPLTSAGPVMSLLALPRGTYLISYSLTVINDTPGTGDVITCGLHGENGAGSEEAPRAVRLDNPGSNVATLSGQAKATFDPFPLNHLGEVNLICGFHPGFSVAAGATMTALPVT